MKNKTKLGLAGLFLIASLTGCFKDADGIIRLGKYVDYKEAAKITLNVGEEKTAKNNVDDWAKVTYCGMNSDSTFSLALSYSTGGINIYYPTKSKIITFNGENFKVLDVTPEKISLEKLAKQ